MFPHQKRPQVGILSKQGTPNKCGAPLKHPSNFDQVACWIPRPPAGKTKPFVGKGKHSLLGVGKKKKKPRGTKGNPGKARETKGTRGNHETKGNQAKSRETAIDHFGLPRPQYKSTCIVNPFGFAREGPLFSSQTDGDKP